MTEQQQNPQEETESEVDPQDDLVYHHMVRSQTAPTLSPSKKGASLRVRVEASATLSREAKSTLQTRPSTGPSFGTTRAPSPGEVDVHARRFMWTGTPLSDEALKRSSSMASLSRDAQIARIEGRRPLSRPADMDIHHKRRPRALRVRTVTRSQGISLQEETQKKLDEMTVRHAETLASTPDTRLRQAMMQQILARETASEERVSSLKLMVKHALKRHGKRSTEQLETAFRRADMDRSGELDFDEFRAALGNYGLRELSVGALHTLFKNFDRDDSGSISYEEFYHAVVETKDPGVDERAARWARVEKPKNPLQAMKREAFEVTPPTLELGELQLGRTYRCALRVRNAGDTDIRARVWLEPPHANRNRVRISEYPRGPVAPGLKAYVEIEVAVNVPGPLSCTVNIKSGQKLITVPLTAHLSLRKMKQDHPGAPARNALEHPERPWPLLPEMWEHTQREVGEAGKLLDRIAVLNMCPKAQKKEFAARLRRCRFEPEDVLIQQGDMSTPPRILFIAQGEAIVVLSPEGDPAVNGKNIVQQAIQKAADAVAARDLSAEEVLQPGSLANSAAASAADAAAPPGTARGSARGSGDAPATARGSVASARGDSGAASQVASTPTGPVIVRTLVAPFYVGEGRLLSGAPASASVVVNSELVGFALGQEDARELLSVSNQTLMLLQRDVRVREFERGLNQSEGGVLDHLNLGDSLDAHGSADSRSAIGAAAAPAAAASTAGGEPMAPGTPVPPLGGLVPPGDASVSTAQSHGGAGTVLDENLSRFATTTRYAPRYEFFKRATALENAGPLTLEEAVSTVDEIFTTFIERVDGTRPVALSSSLSDELVKDLKSRKTKAIAMQNVAALQNIFAGKLVTDAERVVIKYLLPGFTESEHYQNWLNVLFPYPAGASYDIKSEMELHRRRTLTAQSAAPPGVQGKVFGLFDDAINPDGKK